jgi:hypothetical protein
MRELATSTPPAPEPAGQGLTNEGAATPLPTGTAPPTELACGRLLAALCAALPPLERRFLLGRFRRASYVDLSPTGQRPPRRFRRANAPSTPHTGVTQAASDVGFLAERIKAQDQRLLQVRARHAAEHTLSHSHPHWHSVALTAPLPPLLRPSFLPSPPPCPLRRRLWRGARALTRSCRTSPRPAMRGSARTPRRG